MRKLFVFLVLFLSCATTIPPEIRTIRAHPNYNKLTDAESELLDEIMNMAMASKRKDYYFSKLNLMLGVDKAPAKNVVIKRTKEMQKSVDETKKERRRIVEAEKIDIEDYLNQEEIYENLRERKWKGYRPDVNSPYFYVADEDPLDLLVHIRVRVNGSIEMIEKILLLEDAIEKHLYVEGFSVNLVFVGHSEDSGDIFDVKADPSRWPTSHNWSSGHKALAHELMHLMGLKDEYDRIEAHADNAHMSILQRLYQFKMQMEDELPSDAKQGIMCYCNLKPLERHVCEAVGLGEKCVNARLKAFH